MLKSAIFNLKAVKLNIDYMRQQNILGEFKESLLLKKGMLKCHLMLALLYCALVIFGLLMHDLVLESLLDQLRVSRETELAYLTKIVICKELIEILLLSCIFWNVRPRQWPRYFTLDVAFDPLIGQALWQQEVPHQNDFRHPAPTMDVISINTSTYADSSVASSPSCSYRYINESIDSSESSSEYYA